jgi:TonB family protein
MFQVLQSRKLGQHGWLLASFLLHIVLLCALLLHAPIFVKPSSVAWGQGGKSENVIYFAKNTAPSKAPKKLALPVKKQQEVKPVPEQTASTRAGTPVGSLYHGPGSGFEAMPALPLVFPDPDVYPWQLRGLQGDVIVEVTIDAKGNVTDTRVLQSLQPEIDEKVIATLKSWRFRPATVDGAAISSRQDVHFHFPS